MVFLRFVAFLFLICGTSFYLVIGQTINNEKSDCTKLNNFLNGDSNDYANNCCYNNHEIICNSKGYITKFSRLQQNIIPDYTNFPYLSSIEELNIKFDDNLKEIPDSILKLSSLKKLYIIDSKIEIVPPAIQNLSNLEDLRLYNNDIKKLPSEIFDLMNLKILFIDNNINLNAKIIKFGNSTIEECDFNDTNILCYEPHTCKAINFKHKEFSDDKAGNFLNICTKEEINEILSQKNNKKELSQGSKDRSNQDGNRSHLIQENKESSISTIIITIIILGSVSVVSIGIFITNKLIKKRKYRKCNKSDAKSYGEFQTESINPSINNNSSTVNDGISSNSESSNSSNSSNTTNTNTIENSNTQTSNNLSINSSSSTTTNTMDVDNSNSNIQINLSQSNIMVNLNDMIQLYKEELY